MLWNEVSTTFTLPPVDLLPNCEPLPGAVVAQYRTRNDKRFGPYWFRVWRDEDGRQRKVYVPRSEVDAVRLACKVHKARGKSAKERARAWASWRRKDARAWRDFGFLLGCKVRLDGGRTLHYTQERKARRIMGLEAA